MKAVKNDERGTVTATVVIFTVALLAVVGLVYDGGQVLAARRRAFNHAEAAARAGAQALDLDMVRATGGDVMVDVAGARRRALAHLAAAGHSMASVSVDGDLVRVEVVVEQPTAILGAIGIGSVTVEGAGEARAVPGIVTGGDR